MLRHWGHTLNGVLKKAITIAGEDIPRGPPADIPGTYGVVPQKRSGWQPAPRRKLPPTYRHSAR
jgi:hypothetical protein